MVYALFVALISLLFALQTGRDYAERRRPYQALWTAALAASAIGSLGYAAAVQWINELAFRLYYIFGALWVAPIMGLGSVYLVAPRKAAQWIAGLTALGLVIGSGMLLVSPIDQQALANLAGSSGQGVYLRGAWLAVMILLNVFGAAAVVGIAIFSAFRAARSGKNLGFMWGNLLIGLGFLIISAAGSAARWWPNWEGSFWVTMALGWLVAYAGFRVITRTAEALRKA